MVCNHEQVIKRKQIVAAWGIQCVCDM
jgi:hypothetical protein